MLICSMSTSVDGFIADRQGAFGWTTPYERRRRTRPRARCRAVAEHIALDLIETRPFGSRVIYERYGRARDESD